MIATITWLLLLSSEGSRFGHIQSVVALRLLVGLILFACLAWLATRRQEPVRWRWTFAVMALAPVAAWLFTVTASLTRVFPNQMMSHLIPTAAAAGVQCLVLLAAMAGDLSCGTERHWSHWVGAGMRLAVLGASAGMHTYYCLFPQVISVQ